MNTYRKAMDLCTPPPDSEERLQQRLSAAPVPQSRVIRPRSFVRRALLAAVLVLMITASVGATFLLDWDDIFTSRFGPEASSLPVTETAYQKVNVTSVCGDVTLSIREALGDNKTIYLILDYVVPVSLNRETLQNVWDSETNNIGCPKVSYFPTDTVNWEMLHSEYQSQWADTDWADWASLPLLMQEYQDGIFDEHRFFSGSSTSVSTRAYDAETGTLTYLLRFTTDSSTQNLTDQPLTLLVFPPIMSVDNEDVPLADQPALITFQPEYTARVKTGEIRSAENSRFYAKASVSPFSISVEYYGTGYEDVQALYLDTLLVYKDGNTVPAATLVSGYGGGGTVSSADKPGLRSWSSPFKDILEPAQVTAVRIGSTNIPLEKE